MVTISSPTDNIGRDDLSLCQNVRDARTSWYFIYRTFTIQIFDRMMKMKILFLSVWILEKIQWLQIISVKLLSLLVVMGYLFLIKGPFIQLPPPASTHKISQWLKMFVSEGKLIMNYWHHPRSSHSPCFCFQEDKNNWGVTKALLMLS